MPIRTPGQLIVMAAGPPPPGPLPVPQVDQVLGELCWAACAAMVARFHGMNESLCTMARRLKPTDCCQDLESCNSMCTTTEVASLYNLVGLLANRLGRSATFTELDQEIQAGRCMEIGIRPDGSGHLIVGTWTWVDSAGVQMVEVNDPTYGPRSSEYDRLLDVNFQECWTHIGS